MQIDLPQSTRAWHRRVVQLTWPVILANLTIPLVGIADVAVMGRLPDPIYIASVTMGTAMFSAVYWLFGFLRMGTTGLAAQAFGRGENHEIVAIGLRAGIIALVLGSVIIALQWPLKMALFALFDAGDELNKLAQTYYEIRVWGAPGLLLNLVQLGILFSLQRMRDTLWLSIGLNITNLVLDIVLVLGLGMGVEGVALGTIISEWGAALFGFWLVYRALVQRGWDTHLPNSIWQADKVQALFHVSGNLILRTFFVQLPFFAGTVVATSLGELTLAAHGVLMQLFFIMTFSLDGFAHTAETLCGYTYGAGNTKALKNATYYCGFWGVILALITALAYAVWGDAIIAMLTTSTEIQTLASTFLPWLAVAPTLCVFAFLFDGIFIGTTHIVEMRNSMIMAASIWVITLWLSFDAMGYHGVWLSMSLFMLIRSGLMAMYYPRIVKRTGSQISTESHQLPRQ